MKKHFYGQFETETTQKLRQKEPMLLMYLSLFSAFCEGGRCLVCEKTVRGIQNGTESCKNAGDFCFASWEDENARVLSKGCFETYGHGWLHPECQQDACIQADGEPYGFCCCNTNLCNANFTAVDDEPTIPPRETSQ